MNLVDSYNNESIEHVDNAISTSRGASHIFGLDIANHHLSGSDIGAIAIDDQTMMFREYGPIVSTIRERFDQEGLNDLIEQLMPLIMPLIREALIEERENANEFSR